MSLVDREVKFQSLLVWIAGKWNDHGPKYIPSNHVGLNYIDPTQPPIVKAIMLQLCKIILSYKIEINEAFDGCDCAKLSSHQIYLLNLGEFLCYIG